MSTVILDWIQKPFKVPFKLNFTPTNVVFKSNEISLLKESIIFALEKIHITDLVYVLYEKIIYTRTFTFLSLFFYTINRIREDIGWKNLRCNNSVVISVILYVLLLKAEMIFYKISWFVVLYKNELFFI